MFRICITELPDVEDPAIPAISIERYSQCVNEIDLPKIIAAVNARPRKPRAPAKKDSK